MKIPYPLISKTKPFFYANISGFDFTSVTTTGDTQLQVYRVWRNDSHDDSIVSADGAFNMPPDFISPYDIPPYYSGTGTSAQFPFSVAVFKPIAERGAKYTFVFDDTLFSQASGRYRADFYYKGTYVSRAYFVYQKPNIEITGTADV